MAAITFWLSDPIVEKIHSLTQIPWEESINKSIPFGLPNEGLAFPILLGRLIYIGFLAGLLIVILSRFHLCPGLSIRHRRKDFNPFSLYTLPTALCLWVVFLLLRTYVFSKEGVLSGKALQQVSQVFSRLFHGERVLESILMILVGIIVLALALVALGVLLILPMLYFRELSQDYGKSTILYFLMNTGLHSGIFAFLILGLYYGIKTGFAGKAIKVIFLMITIPILLYLAVMAVLLVISAVLKKLTIMLSPTSRQMAVERVRKGVEEKGDNYVLTVTEQDGTKKQYRGQAALDYVERKGGIFEDYKNPWGK